MSATAAKPLLDMLGARWRVEVPATSVAWAGLSEFAGFALGDGSLALAPAAWEGGPMLRVRESGGIELVAATDAAPPVARVPVHRGACLSVVIDPEAGFLTGGADGQITRVLADGEIRVIARLDGPAAHITTGRGGWRVCANGRAVYRLGGSAGRIDVATDVTALALDPTGARVAIGHEGGVTLWAGGDAPRVLPAPGRQCGLAWSHDATWLASFTPVGKLHAWRLPDPTPVTIEVGGPVNSLGTLGNGFVVGVGGRVLRWLPARAGAEPETCGVANQTAVTRVACHPRLTLVAAGYGNGTVVLCQPSSPALLFLRAAGEGAVSALSFSPEGDHLAIGTDGGEIAVLALPDMLFRDGARLQ
jgi:hypothetical protein